MHFSSSADRPGPRPTLILIASAGHSGSTLLDLLLGSHSRTCSAGEMNRLTLFPFDRVCACGATVAECSFWSHVLSAVACGRSCELTRWDDWHTDVPPQQPLFRLDGLTIDQLQTDSTASPVLLRRMAEAGVPLSDQVSLSRSGVRDFKWHLADPATDRKYVLRRGKDCIDVYGTDVQWKNPVRLLPDVLEMTLAIGVSPAFALVRRYSSAIERYVQTGKNSWAVVDAMAEVSGRPFVIDSSKSPVRLKLLYMLHPDRVRIIHLVRDGRAVSASAMRRRDMSAAGAARVWKRDNQHLNLMLRSVPDELKIHVRYEALCDNPTGEITRICRFLGLEFESSMLTFWQRPVHNIPGNPVLFDRSSRTIRKDERWRRDLSEGDIRAFDRTAGRLNRSLGYV